jgi:tetratricopeptide (TPR) repeat protein
LAHLFNDFFLYDRARQAAHHALELAERAGDPECIAHALVSEASAAFTDATYDGETAFQRATEIFTSLGNRRMVGITLGRRARSLGVQGHEELAAPLYEQALSISRSVGDERTAGQVLNNLAENRFHDGDIDGAIRLASEAIEFGIAARLDNNLISTHGNLCSYHLWQGNADEAYRHFSRGLTIARESLASMSIGLYSLSAAGIAAERGRFEEAAVLLGHYLPAFREAYGCDELEETERMIYDRTLSKLREHLDKARLQHLIEQGAALTHEEILEKMLAVS